MQETNHKGFSGKFKPGDEAVYIHDGSICTVTSAPFQFDGKTCYYTSAVPKGKTKKALGYTKLVSEQSLRHK